MQIRPISAVLLALSFAVPLGCSRSAQTRLGWPFARLGAEKNARLDDQHKDYLAAADSQHPSSHASSQGVALLDKTRHRTPDRSADHLPYQPKGRRDANAAHPDDANLHDRDPTSDSHPNHDEPARSSPLDGTLFEVAEENPIRDVSLELHEDASAVAHAAASKSTPTPEGESPAANSGQAGRFARDNQYRWLLGRLEFRYRTRDWRIRYAAPWQEDLYGGTLVLQGGELNKKWQDGAWVRVSGSIHQPPGLADAPVFRVDRAEFLDPTPAAGQ